MASNSENCCTNSSFLSLRLTCNRCRAHKLKCSVPAGSSVCQRCKRASVTCIFGRRNPPKRKLSNANQTATRSPSRQGSAPITPPPTVELAESSASASNRPTRSPEPTMGTILESQHMSPTAHDLQTGPCDPQSTWNGLALELHALAPNMSEWNTDTTTYGHLHSGLTLDETNLFSTGQSEMLPWSQSSILTPTASWPMDEIAPVNTTFGPLKTNNTAILADQRLTTLVSEVQQQLRKLEDGPWHNENVCSLDDYPIGTILELSQQFRAISGPIISSTAGDNTGSEYIGQDDEEAEKRTSRGAGDTATMLLVMCGYMCLVRTYGVVLSHFQLHLNRIPTNHRQGTRRPGSASTTSLRLGQLPCADVALSLQKIHIALSMLLDELSDIESQLGRGAAVVRGITVSSLLNSERRADGSDDNLNKKALAVKELLRKKMGL